VSGDMQPLLMRVCHHKRLDNAFYNAQWVLLKGESGFPSKTRADLKEKEKEWTAMRRNNWLFMHTCRAQGRRRESRVWSDEKSS
jgi:hypothetical protein